MGRTVRQPPALARQPANSTEGHWHPAEGRWHPDSDNPSTTRLQTGILRLLCSFLILNLRTCLPQVPSLITFRVSQGQLLGRLSHPFTHRYLDYTRLPF